MNQQVLFLENSLFMKITLLSTQSLLKIEKNVVLFFKRDSNMKVFMKHFILFGLCISSAIKASAPPLLVNSSESTLFKRIEQTFARKKVEHACCETPSPNRSISCILTKSAQGTFNTKLKINLCDCTIHDTQYEITLGQDESAEIIASRQRIAKHGSSNSPLMITTAMEKIFKDVSALAHEKAQALSTSAKIRTFTLNKDGFEEE